MRTADPGGGTTPHASREDGPTVGFDLDLTLADTRQGIGDVYRALAAETGVFIDVDEVLSRLGPPLEHELAHWFPAERIEEMAARYRALYGDIAVPASKPMPGAFEAVEAVRAAGGRTLVVTAKSHGHAVATVEHLGLPVDAVVGGLFGTGKAVALREHGAQIFVGDHIADVDAARAAAALGVAVATGPFDAAELRAHGADVVLPDLGAFPEWLAGRRAAS
ncbi:HAD family hydrolase [Thermomonospora cellulosilytica]|uniref:Phosphoglycolate phosphatase n=1 Tax=Thermomonospora cellulosilytica TaxID=1411118 RepID=A0A7W3R8I1_9ACTN|nr:HAD hydrolase-like protein [Thermomonospora cellulosilytica]MBA9003360.1 phosphoglycolate phosphatase [Thermomonospora cellulosilytica]